MDNPRIIHAPINMGRRYGITSPITQYDYGYLLLPEGVELPTTYEIDFSNDEKHGTSFTVYGNSEGAEVPEVLIRTGKDVFAFYYEVGEGYGKTEYTWRIPNNCRPIRDGQTSTPTQQSSIDQLIVRSNEAVESAEQSASDADQSARESAESARASGESALSASNSALSSGEYASNALGYAESASASAGTASAAATSASASAASAYADAERAEQAASTATNKASEATTAAQTATTKAGEAQTSAQTASSKASEASQSASQASGYAQTAETAKTDAQTAKTQADTARDEAVTAKTAAETAQGKAEDAQAAAESVAESIPSDYSQLSEDVSDLKEELKQQTIFSDIVFENGSAIYDIVYTNYAVSQTTGQQSAASAIRASSPQLYYIPFACELHVTYNSANQNIVVFCFSENGTLLGIKYGRDVADGIMHLFEGTRYVRFLVYNVDNSEITPEQASSYATYTCVYIGRVKETSDSVNKLAQKFDRSFVNNNLLAGATLVSGYYNGDRNPSDLYVYFPKIPVENGKTYTIYPRARMVYIYDANGTLINYLNQQNIKQITAEGDGFAYVTYYTADDLNSALFYEEGAENVYSRDSLALSDNIIQTDTLTGKKWAVLGDSFTGGADSGTIQGGAYAWQKIVYPYLIGNRTGINVLSFFAGGRTLAYPAVPDGFINSVTAPDQSYNYQNIPEDVDYITIYLGINDSHHETGHGGDGEDQTGIIPLGTLNDNTINTYYGAWNVVLTWLLTNRPFAHLGIIISNGCDRYDYRTAQLEIAKKYGIPFIDLNGDERTKAMIRPQNNNISAEVKAILLQTQAVDYAGGNYHPNNAAHEFESYIIEAFLRTI